MPNFIGVQENGVLHLEKISFAMKNLLYTSCKPSNQDYSYNIFYEFDLESLES